MPTIEEVSKLRKLAVEMQLEDAEILDKYTDEELANEVYNGIGPESFPAWLRVVIDSVNPTLEPVALIHDAEWHSTDHTSETWHKTNERFKDNGIKAAKYTYGWWNPLRYRVMRQAALFRLACETPAGWRAWNAGDRKKEIPEEAK